MPAIFAAVFGGFLRVSAVCFACDFPTAHVSTNWHVVSDWCMVIPCLAGVVMTVVQFGSRRDRIEKSEADALVSAIMDLPLSAYALSEAVRAVRGRSKAAAGDRVWPGGFVMFSKVQMAAIWSWLRTLPPQDRPHEVRHVLDLALLNLEPDTGLILLRRDEFAEQMGRSADSVSKAMSVLERAGIVRREVARVPGMKGRGMAVYWLNPHAAWNGSVEVRKVAASKRSPPLLRLMSGGSTP